jgi:hypothetical protein
MANGNSGFENLKFPVSRPSVDFEVGIESENSRLSVDFGAQDQTGVGE